MPSFPLDVLYLVAVSCILAGPVQADLPVHCLIQDSSGDWDFHVGPAQPSASPDLISSIPTCGHHIPNTVLSMLALNASGVVPASGESFTMKLTEDIEETPNRRLRAVSSTGEEGMWTMMFDEGFEVRMSNGRSFFAHFKFEALPNTVPKNGDRWTNIAKYFGRHSENITLEPEGETYASYCNQTSTGWWHRRKNNGGLESGCFWASKRQGNSASPDDATPVSLVRVSPKREKRGEGGRASATATALAGVHASVRSAADVWEVSDMGDNSQRFVKEVLRLRNLSRGDPGSKAISAVALRGGKLKSIAKHIDSTVPIVVGKVKSSVPSELPKFWDWRQEMAEMSPDGVDDLSAQFSQGNCGSCYAFSGAQVLQMRFRIQLYRKHNILYPLELSWKTATQCSPYTEGCNGGFAYLTFKYAAEMGLPLADCDAQVRPDTLDATCNWACYRNNSMLFYAKDYGQTGGFAQGATEETMMKEIYENGPVILSFSTTAALEFIYNNGKSYRNDTDVMTLFKNEEVPQEPASDNPRILPWRYTTHSILCVGFGEEPTTEGNIVKYWIVRNSWGDDWGTHGYAKMRRGNNDAAIETSSPWVEPDMDRLPAGFLEHARSVHEARKLKAAAPPATAQAGPAASDSKGGRPAYCKMRPNSPDCK